MPPWVWLLLCVAAVRAEIIGTPAWLNDTTAAADGDDVCSSAGVAAIWRGSLAQHPTPNERFLPEELDYWKQEVVPAAWPSLIGLGTALALLLFFLLWRCLRCCCCGCRGCCCRPKKQLPFRYLTARCVCSLKVVAAALVAGLAAGCALGMARTDPKLVPAGLVVLRDVKLVASNVIGRAEAALAAADGVLDALGEVAAVLDREVDSEGIATQLQCLEPWLDSLPAPALLAADVAAANASAAAVLRPRLASLAAQLAALAGALEPGAGRYALALQGAANASALLLEPPGGLVPRANAFVAAAAALDGGAEDPAALQAVADALEALLPLDAALAELAALQDAVDTLQAAATTDAYVPTALDDLAAVRAVAANVTGIAGQLRGLQGNYSAAQPCMEALLERASRINDSVLLLPADDAGGLGAQLALLRDAQDALGGLVVGSPASSLTVLADQLDAAAPTAELEAAAGQLQAASDLRASLAGMALPAVSADLQAVRSSLNATEPALEAAQAAAAAYLALFYPGGGAPPGAWAALVGEVQGASSAASSGLAQAPPDTSQPDQARACWVSGVGAEATPMLDLLPGLHTRIEAQQASIQSALTSLDSLPDVAPHLASLAGMQAVYARLPQPPRALAEQAEQQLEELWTGIAQALASANETVGEAAEEARGVLAHARAQTVGRLEGYEARWLPTVRRFDKIRVALPYALLGAAGGLAALLLLALAFNYPLGIKLMTVLVLLLAALFFALVAALTAGLKAGSDGCANLDSQILTRLPDALADPGAAAGALAVARYYLLGSGNLTTALQAAAGLDVPALQRRIEGARTQLLQNLADGYELQPVLAAPVGSAVDASYAVQAAIQQALELGSREAVRPVYLSAKAFVCCRALDSVGVQWLALIVSGSCAVALCCAACSALASLDKLGRVKGWCACYRRMHFADENPLGAPEDPAAAKAKQAAAANTAALAALAKPKPAALELPADARGASSSAAGTPRGSGLIPSWHTRTGSGGGAGSEASSRYGTPLGSPSAGSALAASRAELFGASPRAESAQQALSPAGSPRGSGAASPKAAAAEAGAAGASAAGASAAGSGSGSPQPAVGGSLRSRFFQL